ncbi:MFS transporter [bacterium]|nr:MFS transporter [bacterium]MCP5463017.1 MFS transporter [bacterium]
MKITDAATKKSLKASFKDGIFAGAMTGFTQEYFTPFLLLLGGTVRHVGFLSALPNLTASLGQLISAEIVTWLGSRKKTITLFVFLQAVMLIPMIGVALYKHSSPALFIAFVVLFTCFGALANPAWGSLMSDLVPTGQRGHYFGWRNKTLSFVTIGTMFAAGILLFFMKKADVYWGFALLFACAFIWRIISWYFLTKMHEPPLHSPKENHFTLFQFLARLHTSNFAQFVLFVSLMNFSVNVAAPFFNVFMLKDLKFNYLLYTVINLTATFTTYCTIARWGRHADKVGNLKIIQTTAPLIAFIPVLWIINRNTLFLIVAQVFSGFLWAGFNLCSSTFIYDAVSPEKRTRCIAYFNTLNGTALCLGAITGGFLLPVLPPLFGHKMLTLFLISSLLRICVGLTLPRKLKEVRQVEHIKSDELFFSMIGIRPMIGIERKTIRY